MEKQVIFDGSKGRLFGVIHIVEKNISPAVILFHGFTGSKVESHFLFTKLARRLYKEGISVLRFDFYGSGDSEGSFEEMTIETEMEDGKKAVQFLKEFEFVDKQKIGICGLSMGALTAVYVSSQFSEVKGLCLWSPLAFPKIIKKKILTKKIKEKIEKYGKCYIPGIGHYIGKSFINSLEKVNIEGFVKKYKGKVFIIHTKDDASLDLKNPLFYFEKFHKSASSLKMLILDKGGHVFTTEESENSVLEETTLFFKECFEKG
ncbi:MAG: alpha/beta hydrolase [Candidatus Omnitrophica bacterium]|nr:alpha/beta hydrolase [Candidatus Omnitrophota bacterium]MCM8808933.1 alpha/beta hydrolase [Candidatus Omnitrophota bacterium]MCM8810120.1 alpha/beta hydrolase [Candidatus Omnitrophota bacterium]